MFYLALIAIVSSLALLAALIGYPVIVNPLIFTLSFAVGVIVNEVHSYSQFEKSTAYYRLHEVIKATNELLKPSADTGSLRSRYRYSMGVIIDNLRSLEDQINSGMIWPALTERSMENHTDGWALYDRYVRHVANDISGYTFVVPELQKLSNVCSALETVVGTLDAALENPPLIDVKNSSVTIRADVELDDARIKAMKEAYTNLNIIWKEWLSMCDIPSSILAADDVLQAVH